METSGERPVGNGLESVRRDEEDGHRHCQGAEANVDEGQFFQGGEDDDERSWGTGTNYPTAPRQTLCEYLYPIYTSLDTIYLFIPTYFT